MRLYWEVARRSFRRSSGYRLATASGVFVNTVFGYLRAAVLVFVATAAGGTARGVTADELATFVFVSQGFIMVTGVFGDRELPDRIRSGDIVIDLYRPAGLLSWWLATWMGRAGFQLLARGIPPVVLGAIAFDLAWPEPRHWPFFACSVVLASMVGFGIRFSASLCTFWLLDDRGVSQLVTLMSSFFAGLILPLMLFPPWLESVARALPFASMIQVPTEIFIGRYEGMALVGALAGQLLWVAVLLVFGRILVAAATRRVVIQGG